MKIGKLNEGTKIAKKHTSGKKIAGNKLTGNNIAPGKRIKVHKTAGQKVEAAIKGVTGVENLHREVGAEEEETAVIGDVADGEAEAAATLAMKAEAGLMKTFPATEIPPARPRPA